MRYLVLILLLSGCVSAPSPYQASMVLGLHFQPDPSKPVDWGLAEERYK